MDSTKKKIVVEKSCDKADNSCKYTYSSAIQAVLDWGCSIELIEKAIYNRKRKDGSDFPNAETLYKAVLELEEKKNIFLEYADQMEIDDIKKMFEAEKSKMDSKTKNLVVEKSGAKADNSVVAQADNSVVAQATTTTDSSSSNDANRPAIQAVLDEGCSNELIQKAIDNRKSEDGSDFPDAGTLFKAVLDLEENKD